MPDARAPQPLLSLDEAVARVRAAASDHRIAEVEMVDTFDALDRVLAEDVVATLDVPPADNTSMDGYAQPSVGSPPAMEAASLAPTTHVPKQDAESAMSWQRSTRPCEPPTYQTPTT